ncbi:glycosyltransferase family 4 protein [Legionella quinlivanii]|nr:glycosyltransferase family 4 protein [Legionella quinlivanii]
MAEAILQGAKECGRAIELILVCLEGFNYTRQDAFKSLSPDIRLRTFRWHVVGREDAVNIMMNAGCSDYLLSEEFYAVIDDDMNCLNDCDLWIIISDRVPAALLPLKPYIMMIYDYIQRYIPEIIANDYIQLHAANCAKKVWVTTNQTAQDAMQYAGIKSERITRMPMLVPQMDFQPVPTLTRSYFVWTTNLSRHKNHLNSLKALRYYYDQLRGTLECHITGVETTKLFDPEQGKLIEQFHASARMNEMLKLRGNLIDNVYQELLGNAAFLWHTALIDNGTFSVVEAAQMGVPSLSSSYQAMRELQDSFQLDIAWMNPDDPVDMATQLKWMEDNYQQLLLIRKRNSTIEGHFPKNKSEEYWRAVEECL